MTTRNENEENTEKPQKTKGGVKLEPISDKQQAKSKEKSAVVVIPIAKSPNAYIQFDFQYAGYMHDIDAFLCEEFCTGGVKINNPVLAGFYAQVLSHLEQQLNAITLISTSKAIINFGVYMDTFMIGVTVQNKTQLIKQTVNQLLKAFYNTDITKLSKELHEMAPGEHSLQQVEESIRIIQLQRFTVTIMNKISEVKDNILTEQLTKMITDNLNAFKKKVDVSALPKQIPIPIKQFSNMKDKAPGHYLQVPLQSQSIEGLVFMSLLNSLSVDYIVQGSGAVAVDTEALPLDIQKLYLKTYNKLIDVKSKTGENSELVDKDMLQNPKFDKYKETAEYNGREYKKIPERIVEAYNQTNVSKQADIVLQNLFEQAVYPRHNIFYVLDRRFKTYNYKDGQKRILESLSKQNIKEKLKGIQGDKKDKIKEAAKQVKIDAKVAAKQAKIDAKVAAKAK